MNHDEAEVVIDVLCEELVLSRDRQPIPAVLCQELPEPYSGELIDSLIEHVTGKKVFRTVSAEKL